MLRLDIPQAIKNKFKQSSVHKDLIIKFYDYDTDKSRNYALNNPVYVKDITATYGYAYHFDNFYIDPLKSNTYDYMITSMKVKLSNYTGDAQNPNLQFTIGKQTAQLQNAFTPNITTVDEWITISCINSLSDMIGIGRLYIMDSIFNNGAMTAHVEIKDIKVEYTNDVNGTYTEYTSYGISAEEDYSDITNENLLEESFILNESLCSQDDLRFGACEASYIEFECCNKNGKYKKKNISAYINTAQENVCHGLNLNIYNPKYQGHGEFSNNYGLVWGVGYGVNIRKIPQSLINQYKYIIASMYIRYTYLSSENPITAKFGIKTMDGLVYYDTTRQTLLEANSEWVRHIAVIEASSLTMKYLSSMQLHYSGDTADIKVDYKQAMLELSNTGIPSDYTESYIFNGGDYKYLLQGQYQVPLGKYHVTSVQKTSNKGTKRIQAYDNSTLLDVNAEDWYASYMYGVSFDDYISNGFQFARQIFAAYFNIVKFLSIDTDDRFYSNEILSVSDITSYKVSKYMDSNAYSFIRYAKFTISNVDVNRTYKVHAYNVDLPDDYIIEQYLGNKPRGKYKYGNILIEEVLPNSQHNRFVVDDNDLFALSETTTSINIYVACSYTDRNKADEVQYITSVTVSEVDYKPDLKNAATRLMYYNYGTQDIFNAPGGITARQVVQSLLEVCGCFFMINRYGVPSFIYCVKSSLYPSETLYPDTDLYPRGTGETADKSLYKEYEFEDYQVKDIGKIQIKKLASDNVTPICEWEYIGDVNKENTYIISDNVFYCSTEMEYDYDNMPEVSTLLANMFSMISNIGFIPHDTKAVGLPYVEVGDRIRLEETGGSIETFIFSRYLKGIQTLEDNYEATGREKTQAISNYGYSIWEG